MRSCLPGGQINPDRLRTEPKAIEIIRAFYSSGKTLAAICHAPWLLIEAGVIRGKKVTSYHSIKTDVINAGGDWRDEAVVTDRGMVTSRNPGDLDAFYGQDHRGGSGGHSRRSPPGRRINLSPARQKNGRFETGRFSYSVSSV